MWQGHPISKIVVVGILILIGVYLILRFMFINRKTFGFVFGGLVFLAAFILIYIFIIPPEPKIIKDIFFNFMVIVIPLSMVIVLTPDIRSRFIDAWTVDSSNVLGIKSSSESTKENIIDAVVELSNRKIGAIITLENHNTLDQYAEKAIMINGKVTKELILNIFTPLTPLHDGAVIVRGDEILCAGAYFTLSTNDFTDKTIGSRHRAALGISEKSDSLTIVVSEETGDISLAVSSMLIKLNNREKLLEYLNMYIK